MGQPYTIKAKLHINSEELFCLKANEYLSCKETLYTPLECLEYITNGYIRKVGDEEYIADFDHTYGYAIWFIETMKYLAPVIGDGSKIDFLVDCTNYILKFNNGIMEY